MRITAGAKSRKGKRSRRGDKKILSETLNTILVVYPFEVDNEKLRAISSEFIELSGNPLGVAEVVTEPYDTDVKEESDREDEANARNLVKNTFSPRSCHLTITEADKYRLEPGQLLNDTLVDLWMSW